MCSPVAVLSPRLTALLGQTGVDRGFLADRPIRPATRAGQAGIDITVRLTSYRSLPLSCIAGITLAVDARPVSLDDACLVIAGVAHRLDALGTARDIWWFILDEAVLFVPMDRPPQSPARWTGRLETVEPYVTAGRLSFFNGNERVLMVEDALS